MENKPRHPWAAAGLTLLETGLGHMYAGRLKRGVVLFVIGILLPLVFSAFTTIISLNAFYIYFTVSICIAFSLFCIVDAALIAGTSKNSYEPKTYNKWYAYIGYLLIAWLLSFVVLIGIIEPFFVQAFKMPTGSMEPTVIPGDYILANKLKYRISDPRRGDLVLFKYPKEPDVAYIKRAIGMPGDTVEINGRTVYINGDPLKETYVRYINPQEAYEHYGPVYVPKKGDSIELSGSSIKLNGTILKATMLGSYQMEEQSRDTPFAVSQDYYFVLGDNRDNSADSRYWGGVPRDYVLGKPMIIYWSFETPRRGLFQPSLSDRIYRLFDLTFHFFGKTRWSRIFKPIE